MRRRPGGARPGRDGQPVAGRPGQAGRRRARAAAAGHGRQPQGRREPRAPVGPVVAAAAAARAVRAAAAARAGAVPPPEGLDQAVTSVPGPARSEVGRAGSRVPGGQAAPTAGRARRSGRAGGPAALALGPQDGVVPSQVAVSATTEIGPGRRAVFLVAGTELGDRARVGGTDRGQGAGAARGDQTMAGSRGRTRRRDRDGDVR